MQQQAWKQEKDKEAKRKGGDEGEKSNCTPQSKAHGKAKGAAKTKARNKPGVVVAMEEPTETPKGRKTSQSKHESKKKTEAAKKKATQQIAGKPVRWEEGSGEAPAKKRKGSVGPVEVKGDGKKTFARRYKPTTSYGSAKWEALRSAYTSIVAIHQTSPSQGEARLSVPSAFCAVSGSFLELCHQDLGR